MNKADIYLKDGVEYKEVSEEIANFVAKRTVPTSEYASKFNDLVLAIDIFFEKQAKPSLTEDEKVILRYVNTNLYTKIGKHTSGEIIFRNIYDSYSVITPYFNFENMFQFIQPRRRI